ncbi:hypothetical protein BN946_scf184487.g1 [Trametes cinnabarina]|uniref:Reverse transcriptase Ty1/copia-type domain-containing protein n=1 Tax=Pycnoporus cinnabarinus TaxID=5643 RepID=A0A060SUW6_PYCCI|nr:hypothetical protein BN946_scf184487.g1 [Trametes cinnabarina]
MPPAPHFWIFRNSFARRTTFLCTSHSISSYFIAWNVYSDRDPVDVEPQSIEDGDELEAQAIRFVLASQYKTGLPNSYRDAMKSPDADKWRAAEKAEYDSLMENKTWVLVPRPKDRQVVANHWVYDIKHDGHYKARLVAKGITQVWGEDYHETFSPVVRFESIRYLLAHAALEDWDIESMDVKTAFLNGDLEEEMDSLCARVHVSSFSAMRTGDLSTVSGILPSGTRQTTSLVFSNVSYN